MIVTPRELPVIGFHQAYEAANTAQCQAIDLTEGAVLVVAGPGTGKTQIIAARIARILQQGGSPETILCLTYTEAGTIAMRERLVAFIGPDAYRVGIFTFHAFCNQIIQTNPAHFGFGGLQPVSELEKRFFVKEVLDGLPPDNPLARERGDLYSDVRGLLDLYGVMKREDWTAQRIEAAVTAHLDRLPHDPAMRYSRRTVRDGVEFLPGDPKQHLLEGEARKFARLTAAVRTLDDYRRVMTDRGRYDFDDMILWVIDALRASPELLGSCQERYQYLLVDEYQDTSGAQNEIVELLMGFWDDPNLFVVGDDDQSIYRFQGANIANILSCHDRYRPRVVTLTGNYRSTRQILAAAQALIGHNRQRLAGPGAGFDPPLDKTLTAHRPDGDPPEVRTYPNQLQEALGIGRELEEAWRGGGSLDETAVLYRNHRQAEPLIRYLAARGVPYRIRKREDLLKTPVVGQLVMLLTYLREERARPRSGERLLFRILHYPVFGLSPLAVAELYAQRESGTGGAPRPVRELLRRSAPGASALVEGLLARIDTVTLQELVQTVIARAGLLPAGMPEGAALAVLEQLNGFFDFLQEECGRAPGLDLEGLLTMLDLMAAQGVELPAERLVCSESGVSLITCHSSKGLEFRTVYLLGCTEGEWEKKRSTPAFTFPPGLNARADGGDEAALEELRRLFFVAMTRAQQQLVISCAERDNQDRPLARSRFVAELEVSGTITATGHRLEGEELATGLATLVAPPPAPATELFRAGFITELLRDYRLSVTHLNSYLSCPRAFFYTRLLRIPEPRSPAMAFGSSVHESLEWLFREMQRSGARAFPPREEFVACFAREMARRQDAFTPVEYERRLERGCRTLAAYYDAHREGWHREVQLEKSFLVVLEGGERINGLVDKLELLEGNRVNLVDYKTGRFDRKKLQPPDPAKVAKADGEGKEPAYEDRYGGDYWRQAVFYKIMVERSPETRYRVDGTLFSFVEPDERSGEFISRQVGITPQDEAQVLDQIRSVYAAIMNREFDRACGDRYCSWCGQGG
jgi:DNA helicase-2/ATP-dependent DNA helicase PcrA